MTIFSTKFESWCKFFSPIKLVSLRKLAPSRNAVCNHQTGIDFVTEISFCKTPVVDEKRLVFRGWELESKLGKSFKVSGQTFIRRRTHSHNLWLLLVNNRTKWSLIRSVIILVTNKFCYHSYDYRQNWTPHSPITITYQYADQENLHPCLKSFQTRACFQLVFHWLPLDRTHPSDQNKMLWLGN